MGTAVPSGPEGARDPGRGAVGIVALFPPRPAFGSPRPTFAAGSRGQSEPRPAPPHIGGWLLGVGCWMLDVPAQPWPPPTPPCSPSALPLRTSRCRMSPRGNPPRSPLRRPAGAARRLPLRALPLRASHHADRSCDGHARRDRERQGHGQPARAQDLAGRCALCRERLHGNGSRVGRHRDGRRDRDAKAERERQRHGVCADLKTAVGKPKFDPVVFALEPTPTEAPAPK